MKKTFIAFSTIGLLLSGMTAGSAFADGVEPETAVTEGAETEEELDLVNLTLDTVIQRALEDDSNLLLLSYQLDLLGDIERITENDLDDIEDIIDMPRESFLPGTRSGYYDNRDALLDALEQLPYQERMAVINQESTKEMIVSSITNSYVQMLTLQEQIELSKESLKWLEEDLRVLKLQNQVGLASQKDISDLMREITNTKRTIEDTQLTYERALLQILVNLNIPYSEGITLADIDDVETVLPERPENIEELVQSSFQIQSAKENLEVAELTLEQQWYNGLRARKENQVKVEEAKINKSDLETELFNKITALYDNAETQYLEYQDQLRELSYLEEDQRRLNLQYQVGLVSKHEFEKMARSFKQAQVNLKVSELDYFLTLEKIEAVQRGHIQ